MATYTIALKPLLVDFQSISSGTKHVAWYLINPGKLNQIAVGQSTSHRNKTFLLPKTIKNPTSL